MRHFFCRRAAPTHEVQKMAGRQGFEPRYRGPEPRVLPLDDLPTRKRALIIQDRTRMGQATSSASAVQSSSRSETVALRTVEKSESTSSPVAVPPPRMSDCTT